MKILFLASGTTHYFNRILSKLNLQENIELLYVTPDAVSVGLGAGVVQTEEGANFPIYKLEEKYDIDNGFYFPELTQFISEHRPDIIVTTENHLNSVTVAGKLRTKIDELGIKVILKTIPFALLSFDERIKKLEDQLKNNPSPQFKSFPSFLRNILNFSGFNKLYKRLVIDARLRKHEYARLEKEKFMFNKVDAHVNYIEDARRIYGSYGVNFRKLFLTYNSPDTDFYFSVRESIEKGAELIERREFRILHLSRLVEWKRVDMLIQSVANLSSEFPEIELLVVGTGPELTKLKNMAASLNIESKVIFKGAIYDPYELGKCIMSSSLYVLAGVGGLSINDAMIYGLPVICSVCDGTEKFLVKDEYNGLYFLPGDQKSLDEKIRVLLSNEKLRIRMGLNSEKIIREEININTVIKGYTDAFHFVTGR